jgi:hypothetical protein
VVVFEDTIRRIGRDRGIKEKGQSLEDLINALAKQDVITGNKASKPRSEPM